MSDGGDGFGSVIGGMLGARTRRLQTTDAAGRPRPARWWWSTSTRTAVIETAESNGLALLPKGRFHPFDLDTTGVADLIRAAVRAGARRCFLGVGGSATNDGGFGMARALGWRFLDRQGAELSRWTDLDRLDRLAPPAGPRLSCHFVVATDVSNPLLGRTGASRVYGPQKGLRPSDFPRAERCLRRLAQVVERNLGLDHRSPGCGAAGGLGFGLQAFLGAERQLGFDLFAELARLERRLERADLVVTGEGSFDPSSLMGKGVGQLLNLCQRLEKPVIVLGGRVEVGPRLPRAVVAARGLLDVADEATALREPGRLLSLLAREMAAVVNPRSTADRRAST